MMPFYIGQQLLVVYHKNGPILFIIYINDLVEYCSSGSDIFLFADDAKIFSHVKEKKIANCFNRM